MVLRCAVVGLTSIGSRHALGMVGDSRVKLVAGCDDGYADNDGKSAAQVGGAFEANYAAVYPELNIYSSHKEMLAKEPQLDIVTVGVSDHRHADIVVDAANAGVKGIFCEKPLATTLEDTDRMLAACEQNGVILSVDHTRRFLPIWRYCKEQLVDKGAIGEIQYIIARLHGPRSMLWRNGTHIIDCMLWFAGAKPKWVMGDFEEGYEDYDRYGQRGMDGGKDPALEPAVNGYISFENGVKGFYVGGSKKTPTNIKMEVEVVGSGGRLVVDNAGDGRDATGAWTGTYKASASLWRHGDAGVNGDNTITGAPQVIVPSKEYIAGITPTQGGDLESKLDASGARVITLTTGNPTNAPMIGIAAGVHDLINVVLDPTLPRISTGTNAQDVVEVMSGFVLSAHGGHGRVSLPISRAEVAEQAVPAQAVAARM